MNIVEDEVQNVRLYPSGERPNYNKDNALWRVVDAIEGVELAAGHGHYLVDSVQHLFPFFGLELSGPSGADPDDPASRDPKSQDNKNDFQKQNIESLALGATQISRGYAVAGDWIGPFLHFSHTPYDGSPIADPDGVYPADTIKLHVTVQGVSVGQPVEVPYNDRVGRYQAEFWGFPGIDLRPLLDERGQSAIDRGELRVDTNLVRGSINDFRGAGFDSDREAAIRAGAPLHLLNRAPMHTMHPIRPLKIELAWTDITEQRWDSSDGRNYRYEFGMPFRGWDAYLQIGTSANPHGGVGHLEFRNLFSNYFGHEAMRRAVHGPDTLTELGRDLETWNYDADWIDLTPEQRRVRDQRKVRPERESFFAVDYMDLHVLKPNCGIGIHRHRDNQEVFMLLEGRGLMVVGDWCEFPGRDRALEVRTMKKGDLTLCKTGRLHALLNPLDEDIQLFMFGGYD